LIYYDNTRTLEEMFYKGTIHDAKVQDTEVFDGPEKEDEFRKEFDYVERLFAAQKGEEEEPAME